MMRTQVFYPQSHLWSLYLLGDLARQAHWSSPEQGCLDSVISPSTCDCLLFPRTRKQGTTHFGTNYAHLPNTSYARVSSKRKKQSVHFCILMYTHPQAQTPGLCPIKKKKKKSNNFFFVLGGNQHVCSSPLCRPWPCNEWEEDSSG